MSQLYVRTSSLGSPSGASSSSNSSNSDGSDDDDELASRAPPRRSPQQKRGRESSSPLSSPITPSTALASLTFFPQLPKRDATQLGWVLFGALGQTTGPLPAQHEPLQWERVVRSPTVHGITLRRNGDSNPCWVVARVYVPYFDAILAIVPSHLLRLSVMAVRAPSSSDATFYFSVDIWAPPCFHLQLKRVLEPLGTLFSQCVTSRPKVHTDLVACLGTTPVSMSSRPASAFASGDELLKFYAVISAEATAKQNASPEPADPIGITTELRPYQGVGLAWMLKREAVTPSSCAFALARGWLPAAPSGFMNEWTRETAAALPRDDVAGGILADDMGSALSARGYRFDQARALY
jgi:hypothetical protein